MSGTGGGGRRIAPAVGVTLALGALAWGCGPALTAAGVLGVGALRDDDDDLVDVAPAVNVTTPTGNVNDIIAVSYRITDPDPLDRAHVTVEYSAAGGPFLAATQAFTEGAEGVQNLTTSAAGAEHVFQWNSAADLGFQAATEVRLRITAADAQSGTKGAPATTGSFLALNAFMTTLARPPIPAGIAPAAVAVAPDGDVLVADAGGSRVVRLDRATGAVSIVAGTGDSGYNGDALPGPLAQLNRPLSIAVTTLGDVLIADSQNGLLRRVDGTGFIADVAGGGDDADDRLFDGGALARDVDLEARDLAVGATGVPFVLEDGRGRARALNLQGSVAVDFPTGAAPATIPAPFASLAPGRMFSVVAAEPTTGSASAFALAPADQPTAIAAWESAGRRLLYLLDLGAGGGNVSSRARLGVANFGGASESFTTPGGPVTVAPGEAAVLLMDAELPGLREFADLAVFDAQALLLASGGDGAVYAVNLGPSSVSIAGTTIAPGARRVVVGQPGAPGITGDGGPPLSASLQGPFGVAVDPGGHLILAEPTGRVRVVASPTADYVIGGLTIARGTVGTLRAALPGTTAAVVVPISLALGRDGSLLVGDTDEPDPRSNRLLRVSASDAAVTAIAGDGVFGDLGDGGPATEARLGVGLSAEDPARGVVVFSDLFHAVVRAVNVGATTTTFLGVTITPGEIETVVGAGSGPLGDGGPALQATLRTPTAVFFDAAGLLWLSDTGNDRVRVCNPTGAPATVLGVVIAPDAIATVVGTGAAGTPQDDGDGGPATAARLDAAAAFLGQGGDVWLLDGLALDGGGALNVNVGRVRLVNLSTTPRTFGGVTVAPGAIDTVAGAGVARAADGSNLGDGGPALGATFVDLAGLSARPDGLLFIADSVDARIRVVNGAAGAVTVGGRTLAPGMIDTIVGAGIPGYTGDPSPVGAGFFGVTGGGLIDRPIGLVALEDGRLLFCDSQNGAVRMANLAAERRAFAGIEAAPGTVVVVAGSRAGRVRANTPFDLAVGDAGELLFTDLGALGNEPAVLGLDPTTRVVTRVAGTQERTAAGAALGGAASIGDDGPALLATFASPLGLARDAQGGLYVADAGNRRIRYVNRTGQTQTPVAGVTVRAGDIATVVNGEGGDEDLANDDGVAAVGTTALDLVFPSDVSVADGILWVVDQGGERVVRVDAALGLVDGVATAQLVRAGVGSLAGDPPSFFTSTLTDGTANFRADPAVVVGDTLHITVFNGNPVDFSVAVVAAPPSDTTLTVAQDITGTVTYEVLRVLRPESIAAIDGTRAYVANRIRLSFDPSDGVRIDRLARVPGGFTLTPVAGSGRSGWNGDLLQSGAMNFTTVRGLHASGDLLLVADTDANRLVAVNTGGAALTVAGLTIAPGEARTIAGAGQGESGFNGDALPAPSALLNQPTGVATTSDGGIVLVDLGNGRVRRFQR